MRRSVLLLPLALLLQACVYSSPVPLDQPGEALDEALIGRWLVQEPDDPSPVTIEDSLAATVRVMRFNDREYLAVWNASDCTGCTEWEQQPQYARLFPTTIDGVRFLNAQDVGSEEDAREYSFARYELHGDELRLRFIADGENSERGLKGRFTTSDELRAAVRARLRDPMLYDEEEIVLHRFQPTIAAR